MELLKFATTRFFKPFLNLAAAVLLVPASLAALAAAGRRISKLFYLAALFTLLDFSLAER